MILKPENADCEICGKPAVAQLDDSISNTSHLRCRLHKPDLAPGLSPNMSLRRYRLPPGNAVSQLLAAPPGSEEAISFCLEMTETKLLGSDGACQFYLSKLTDSDQFSLWNNEYLANLSEFAIEQTEGAARVYTFEDEQVCYFMESLLKSEYMRAFPDNTMKLTKQDKAIILLLHNPSWSDERIAKSVPTTTKQLARFCEFGVLRINRNRARKK